MPSSGLKPCDSADGPPPIPLASAYRFTDVMNACPTSAPTTSSNNQYDREAASSRSSFSSSQRDVRLRERKEHLLEPRGIVAEVRLVAKIGERSLTDDAAAAQQHEAIAHARRVAQLVNR